MPLPLMSDAPGFVVVVGAARSGTTLTRLLLDAHPEMGCPSEAGLPALIAHMAGVWATVNADTLSRPQRRDPGVRGREDDPPDRWDEPEAGEAGQTPEHPKAASLAELPEDAREWIVRAVQHLMRKYCAPEGKRFYCDKSLDSVHHLKLVRELFPDVRMVLVFRHVMDTIVSGIEASPWGFHAYGYAPYVLASPTNTVAALASYWLDHVGEALKWEKEHPEICHRVRYEDLVVSPETTVTGMQRFLGVDDDLSVLATAFAREAPRGPGDYKVEHTRNVHAASVGQGKRVPVTMLPPPLLKALNEQLEALGYEPVDQTWNTAERIVDGGGRGLWAGRLLELMRQMSIAHGASDVGTFAVVAEDHRALRWIIDPDTGSIEQGDGDVEGVLTGMAVDLVQMLTGEQNLGVLLRSGRVRHIVSDEEQSDLMGEVKAIVGLLRAGLRHLHDGEIVI
ncbi:MAG: sulfotransferase family protein [Solirubrobacteraceae bacterium]